MVSRNTEKKGKGNRKRSFKKRKMTGGKTTWDYNNPVFIPFQQITPSNPCEWPQGTPIQATPFKKLVEFAYTNNTDAFIHTIQCCFGWKGHSVGMLNTIGMGSNVSRSAQDKTNYFAASGFEYLFEPIVGTTTLLHVAAAWGNDIIIEILLNIGNLNFVYASDPLVKNSKIPEEEYNSAVTAVTDKFKDKYNVKELFEGIDTPYHSLYAKQVMSRDETQLNNEINLSSYKISSNPIRCELLFLPYNSFLTTISIDQDRAANVNELIMGTPYELVYDDAADVRYMPAMVKCTAVDDAIDDKFCPYVASGILGTSSATGIISSESDKICSLFSVAFNSVNTTNQIRDFVTTKICDVLFHYAFRDDQAAFNKILTCATNLYPNETDALCSILQSRTQKSNGTQYTLLHIGAIYGNINIVQPLIDLYKSCNDDDVKLLLTRTETNTMTTVETTTVETTTPTTVETNESPLMQELKNRRRGSNSAGGSAIPPPPSRTPPPPPSMAPSMTLPSLQNVIHFPSVLECLYTRSDVKLSIFYGAVRKSTPSDSYSVQQLFNQIICSDTESNILCNDYTNLLTEIYTNNTDRIGTIVAELNMLDAGSWISKKSILTYTGDADGEYASFIRSDKLILIDGTTKFAVATGNIAMLIGSAVKDFSVNAGSVVKDLGVNASSAVKGGIVGGITYVTSIDGSSFWGAWDAITGQLTVMRDRATATATATANVHPYNVVTNAMMKFTDNTQDDVSAKVVKPTASTYEIPIMLYVFKNQSKPMLYILGSNLDAAVNNDAPRIISFDATGAPITPALLVRNKAITSDNVFLLADKQNNLIIQTKDDELIRYTITA